jgi:hypothetical protein
MTGHQRVSGRGVGGLQYGAERRRDVPCPGRADGRAGVAGARRAPQGDVVDPGVVLQDVCTRILFAGTRLATIARSARVRDV